jgi:plastocyanin
MTARTRLARPTHRRTALLLLLIPAIATLLVLRAGPASSATAAVSIQNFSFNPGNITVAVGDTVTWTNNQAGVPHTVTADAGAFDSGTVASGAAFTFSFTTAGTFTYHCNIHPFMHGTVTVTAASSPAPSSAGETTPTSATATAGGGAPAAGQHLAQYSTGFNLIGVPAGTSLTGTTAVYALNDAGDGYDPVGSDAAIQSGKGYWAYFAGNASLMLPAGSNAPVTLTAPAGRWLMIGNPSGTLFATVSGADALFTFDPVAGQYVPATSLKPGQGAWAFSTKGGTITISPMQPATPTPTPVPQQVTQPQSNAPVNTNPVYTPPMNTQPQPSNPMPMGGGPMPGPYHY